jgi:hypothetical protein
MEYQLKTPVAFLIFNRLDVTQKIFEVIRHVRPTKLLVVADGPRLGIYGEHEKCAAVRAIIDTIDWPCEVLKNYSDINLGCKVRVSSGIDWVFENVEEAIILEDDCLPHPDFFVFCEKMLEFYRDDDRVAMIAGTNYMHDKLAIKESYCFSRLFNIWGWASWRRAWRRYDLTLKDWAQFKRDGQLRNYYNEPYKQKIMASMFDEAFNNRIDTWDIQWAYSCLFNNAVSIVPKKNLISNIGVVGTHTSGNSTGNYFPLFPIDVDFVHPEKVSPNILYDDYMFRKRLRLSLFYRVRMVYQLLKRKIGFT